MICFSGNLMSTNEGSNLQMQHHLENKEFVTIHMDLYAQQNILLKKIGRIMPWFVNAEAAGPVADFYCRKVKEIMALNDGEWEIRSRRLLDEDAKISQRFSTKGLSHYAVKYNHFTGVISDYFLNENNS